MSASSRLLAVTVFALAACGDKDPVKPGQSRLVRIVAGDGVSDTVAAQLLQALVVEVRDSAGAPLPGATVRFETRPIDSDDPYYSAYSAYVSKLDRNAFGVLVADTTDARGRASALVKLGTKAGPALVVVQVPELGAVDTATYTVLPGAAARVRAIPKDTAMYAARTVTLRGAVVDRFDNPRTDPVTFARLTGPITLAGNVATAQGVGRASVMVQAMGLTDTTFISIVPEGTLAARMAQSIVTFNTDGSGFKTITSVGYSPFTTDWSPDGTEIAFDADYGAVLRVTDLSGRVRVASNSGAASEMYPAYSPDGGMLYFAREGWRLRRVKRDGTGDELVPTTAPELDAAPSLSPDGTRLVYVRVYGFGQDKLALLTLATGAVTKLDLFGHTPKWSPRGDLIAYVDLTTSQVKVMNADGTGARVVSPGSDAYVRGIDWSPDGQWLVVTNATKGRLELLDPASGITLPLGFTAGRPIGGPSWKP
jgi:hypothetical protein